MAGGGRPGRIWELPEEVWDFVIRLNLRSTFLCTRAAARQMIRQRSGRIVSISSGAREGTPWSAYYEGAVPYSTAKAGVIGFTKALAKEVAAAGIRVNAVAPAVIETPILSQLTPAQVEYMKSRIPLGRFGRPEEVAPTAVLLAAGPDGNLYVGQVLGPNSGDVMP